MIPDVDALTVVLELSTSSVEDALEDVSLLEVSENVDVLLLEGVLPDVLPFCPATANPASAAAAAAVPPMMKALLEIPVPPFPCAPAFGPGTGGAGSGGSSFRGDCLG
jgi:hypothetical protein